MLRAVFVAFVSLNVFLSFCTVALPEGKLNFDLQETLTSAIQEEAVSSFAKRRGLKSVNDV
jgi:hypothetical protein